MDQISELTKENEALKEIVQKLRANNEDKNKAQQKIIDKNAVSDHAVS